MRVTVVGGGPAGLAAAAWLRDRRPDAAVTVWERDPADGSGFGLVLPGPAAARLAAADPALGTALTGRVGWDRIEVRYRGEVVTSAGHPYRALSRGALLRALRARCAAAGVTLRAGPAPDPARIEADVLVGADGAGSAVRRSRAAELGAVEEVGDCRFLWGWVPAAGDAFAFDVLEAPEGVAVLHRYPYAPDRTAVIVELPAAAWRRFGADRGPGLPAGLAALLAPALGGAALQGTAAGWRAFRSVRCGRWSAGRTVLLGDAAHAAHFSVGSGTRLALGDAWALAGCLAEAAGDPAGALAEYERLRRPPVDALADAADASRRWFETVADRLCPDPVEFARRLLGRSGRVDPAGLVLTRPARLGG